MLFWIFFILIAACALFQLALEILNWSWMKRNRGKVPEVYQGAVDPEKAGRIEAYTQAKIILGIWGDFVGQVLLLGMLLFDGFAWLLGKVEAWSPGYAASALGFFGIMALAAQILKLPFDWYANFRIEERFGFNRMGYGLWFIDLVKGLVLGAIIGGLLLSIVVWLLYNAGSFWWLICWAAVFLFSLLLTLLYPLVIAPLFNKFTPLEEGTFRERVLHLMEKAGIRSKGVFVMDAGKRSTHTNAYFTGFGRSKRIVFYDTLLKKHTEDETLAVLAHEAGHWKKKHVVKNLLLSQGVSLALFAAAGKLVEWEALYGAFGFETVTPYAGLFLVSIVYSPALFFIQPFMALLSRKHEYEADRFAGENMGMAEPLSDMLIKSALDNLSNLNPHPYYVWFHYSHPTVAQRVERMGAKS